MTGFDKVTLQFYDETAPTYMASGQGGVSRHLVSFLATLPPRARILELGCGGGRDAQAMMAAGHNVDATDGSAAIALKAEAILGIPVRVMLFEQLEALAVYDAVWASASLLHVPRAGLPDVLARILRALKPGGLHHATYKGGGQEGRDKHGRYFNYLSEQQMIEMYLKSGHWNILATSAYTGGGYDDGARGPWVAITAQRPI